MPWRSLVEKLFCADKTNVRIPSGMIEESREDVGHWLIDFPIVRREAEIAAGLARFLEPVNELTRGCAGNQHVTTEFCVINVTEQMRVDKPIGF